MPSISEIRVAARAHQREIDADELWLSVGAVGVRWGVSDSTVRAIPRDDLPYLELGTGAKHKRRRYNPADVEAYQEWAKRGKVGPSPCASSSRAA